MLDILKEAHKAAEVARAKAAEMATLVGNTERHVKVLADALNDEEKALYAAWQAERAKLTAKA